jgi:hypothetical protein
MFMLALVITIIDGGNREGINMEMDGDSEEDNDEEVVKQVVKRRFEGRG